MVRPVTLGAAILASVIPFASGCNDTQDINKPSNKPTTAGDLIRKLETMPENQNAPITNHWQLWKLVPFSLKAFSVTYDEKTKIVQWRLESDKDILNILREKTTHTEERNKQILEILKEEFAVRTDVFSKNKLRIIRPFDARKSPPLKLDWSLGDHYRKGNNLTRYGFPYSAASLKGSGFYVDDNAFILTTYVEPDGVHRDGVYFKYTEKYLKEGEKEPITKNGAQIVPVDIPIVIYQYKEDFVTMDYINIVIPKL